MLDRCIWNKSSQTPLKQLRPLTCGDRVMIELDLRETEPINRTMHIFVNGTQQQPFCAYLPKSPRFAVHMHALNDSMEFVSYSQLEQPLHRHVEGEVSLTPMK